MDIAVWLRELGLERYEAAFRDKPAGAFDDGGDAAVVGADQRAQILRVEPRRQRRRADQIAEHHRQLPAFGVALYRCIRARRPNGGRSRGGGHCGTKRGDSVEQPPAMPDQGDTEILQIPRPSG